jgi:hypothetical protein
MFFLLLLLAFLCHCTERPRTPVPSSHRSGYVRVFVPTPPGSPKTKVVPSRRRSQDVISHETIPAKNPARSSDGDLKKKSVELTSISSDSDIVISKAEVIYEDGIPVTVVTWEKAAPETAWWERLFRNFSIKRPER